MGTTLVPPELTAASSLYLFRLWLVARWWPILLLLPAIALLLFEASRLHASPVSAPPVSSLGRLDTTTGFVHGVRERGQLEANKKDMNIQAVMTSIGAYASRKWSDECTHVLVDESSPLTPELLDAILTKKQIILGDWFKAMAEKNTHTEIPSCTQSTLWLSGTRSHYQHMKLKEK